MPHVDAREYADIEKRYPKTTLRSRGTLMTSPTARTRESQLHVDRYPPCASSQQAAKDVRIYTYTESSKDYDVLQRNDVNREQKRYSIRGFKVEGGVRNGLSLYTRLIGLLKYNF